jgi:hypothetical protein
MPYEGTGIGQALEGGHDDPSVVLYSGEGGAVTVPAREAASSGMPILVAALRENDRILDGEVDRIEDAG